MPRLPHPRTSLSGYADSRLPAWRRAVVRRHLLACTRCAMELAEIRALGDVLRATPPPGPPEALLDRLLTLGGVPPDQQPGRQPHPQPGPVRAPVPVPVPGASRERPSLGAAGVLVVVVVMIGTVGAGAAATGVGLPWAATTARTSMSVIPRLWHADTTPAGAVSVQPVDTGSRP